MVDALEQLNALSGETLPRVGERPLMVIAGPCQLESAEHAVFLAKECKEICEQLGLPYIFKASFDKANRTSVDGVRGVGLEKSIPIFQEVKDELGIPVLTDIHQPDQPERLQDTIDVFQIPAFLCRQTDLLVAAGKTGKAVNIKKGQFLHPEDMKFAADKVSAGGGDQILLCERGSCFGYRDLVVDMRGLADMRALGYPVVFDGTHSVQSMGGAGGSSGGSREYIPTLCRAAVAAGVDAVFLEVHEAPERAPSDANSMLPIEELRSLLVSLKSLHETHNC